MIVPMSHPCASDKPQHLTQTSSFRFHTSIDSNYHYPHLAHQEIQMQKVKLARHGEAHL